MTSHTMGSLNIGRTPQSTSHTFWLGIRELEKWSALIGSDTFVRPTDVHDQGTHSTVGMNIYL